MQYDCYVTMEMQHTHYYTTVTITLLWKCNILIVTQQEMLRHYGNAIWCIDHVTTENLICHIAPGTAPICPSVPPLFSTGGAVELGRRRR
jgi:hypothetical protein